MGSNGPVDQDQRTGWWGAIGRPVLAYLAAAYGGSVILALGYLDPSRFMAILIYPVSVLASGIPLLVAALALIPALLAMAIIRMAKLRRGMADVAAGVLVALLLMLLLGLLPSVGPSFWWDLLERLAFYAGAGAMAGLTYWLVLGCPRSSDRP